MYSSNFSLCSTVVIRENRSKFRSKIWFTTDDMKRMKIEDIVSILSRIEINDSVSVRVM